MQYPVRWTAQSALHVLHPLADLFIPTPTLDTALHKNYLFFMIGRIQARRQLRAKAKSLTCPPLSIARHSFIQLSEQGRQWRERKCPIFETVTNRDSNPGSLDYESGILPLSYRAPLSHIHSLPSRNLDANSRATEEDQGNRNEMTPARQGLSRE